jgi:transposase-like protein
MLLIFAPFTADPDGAYDAAAAERFQSQSLERCEPSAPSGHQHRQGRRLLSRRLCNSKPKALWRRIAGIDRCNISGNVLEQDHRAIKRRVRASQHFRSFWGAWRTIAGYEAVHMIRKDQACWSAVGATVGLLHRFIVGMFGMEV